MSGWLEISTAGFASFNSSRKPGHLVKELVQNAFDAIGDRDGKVSLDYRMINGEFVVECGDNGEGMTDLDAIRVVYLTFKKDNHLKRGRFGRGFKEVLSIATWASVESGVKALHFTTEAGKQIARQSDASHAAAGTVVRMALPFGEEIIAEFDTYFGAFLVPANITLTLNGRRVAHRMPKHTIDATLTTEMYHGESHSWRKPKRAARVELVPTCAGEDATIYEMGIPVAVADWSVRFHANVLQRVPMNPNRDALMTGYARSVHAAALPILLPTLDAADATADWVGTAGTACDEDVQRAIVTKAFGADAVRAVPAVGKRDFNDDASRMGAEIVHTNQMSAGFREMAKQHLPTAKQTVEKRLEDLHDTAVKSGFTLGSLGDGAERKRNWIEARGGSQHVDHVLAFAIWFCQHLINHCSGVQAQVTGALALGHDEVLTSSTPTGPGFSKFLAHWSDCNVLTLALEWETMWREPMGAEALSLLIHEAAHGQNQHHGKSFHAEVERLAGIGAAVMFEHSAEIRTRWPDLITRGKIGRAVATGALLPKGPVPAFTNNAPALQPVATAPLESKSPWRLW